MGFFSSLFFRPENHPLIAKKPEEMTNVEKYINMIWMELFDPTLKQTIWQYAKNHIDPSKSKPADLIIHAIQNVLDRDYSSHTNEPEGVLSIADDLRKDGSTLPLLLQELIVDEIKRTGELIKSKKPRSR